MSSPERGETAVVAEELAGVLVRRRESDRVRQSQVLVARAEAGRQLRGRFGERDDRNTHRTNCLACLIDAAGARESDECLRVGAGRQEQRLSRAVCRLDVLNGARVMRVCNVEQADHDTRVEDQRFHSSRSRSSSSGS